MEKIVQAKGTTEEGFEERLVDGGKSEKCT